MAPLLGTDQIKVPSSAVLIFKHPSVKSGPLYIHSGATAIQWMYHLNTITSPTIGGEVVQVLSALVGPMTITGQAAGLKTNKSGLIDQKTEVRGWRDAGARKAYSPNDELKAIIDWFREYMTLAGSNTRGNVRRDERAIKFCYPERGWDFYIQVTKLDGFRYDREIIAPEWSITAEIVSDSALNYFSGITMSSFTDDLITNQALIGKIGLSAFAQSKTETSNTAFGQTGDRGSTNPFLNPELSPSAAEAAKKMGDNFQGLVAAWATGDFAHFGFGALLDNGALPKNVDAAYQQLFGTTVLGSLPGNAGPGTSGSFTYGGNDPRRNYAVEIANAFAGAGLPPELGVAVSLHESSLNPDRIVLDSNNAYSVGLFMANLKGKGAGISAAVVAGQHPNDAATKYWPASAQISAAVTWYRAGKPSGFPTDVSNLSNDQLARWAFNVEVGDGYTSDNTTTGSCTQTFAGNIAQAKSILADATPTNNQGAIPTGSTSNLAKQLLGYYGTKWIDDNGRGKEQITKVANGENLIGALGPVSLDQRTLQVVLALIGMGYSVGTFAWCEDHGADGTDGHAGGKAVDISSINGIAINSSSAHDITFQVAKILRNLKSPINPRQLICGGFGGVRSADISSQCIPAADSFYGSTTMQEHTNHIHVGF